MSPRAPDDLQEEIAAERARLERAAGRLQANVEAVALPRRLPWALVAAAFAAGLGLGRKLGRRGR